MLMTEWNWDDAKQVWQEEAREEGREEGIKKEREYVLDLFQQGLSPEKIEQHLRSL
jgi:hypothetical protein